MAPPEKRSSRPEYCEACFASDSVLHDHVWFLRINARGGHTAVERTVGRAERQTLTEADLSLVPLETVEGNTTVMEIVNS